MFAHLRYILFVFPGMLLAQAPTLVPFYDFNEVSFAEDMVKTIWMDEVPGMPQHFWVMGMYGKIFSLYPTGEVTEPSVVNGYSKSLLADFSDVVHPSIRSEYGAWNISFHPKFEENRKFYIIYMGYTPGQAWPANPAGL